MDGQKVLYSCRETHQGHSFSVPDAVNTASKKSCKCAASNRARSFFLHVPMAATLHDTFLHAYNQEKKTEGEKENSALLHPSIPPIFTPQRVVHAGPCGLLPSYSRCTRIPSCLECQCLFAPPPSFKHIHISYRNANSSLPPSVPNRYCSTFAQFSFFRPFCQARFE